MLSVDDIRKLVEKDEANGKISREELDAAYAEYPYFIVPQILYLQRNKESLNASEKDDVLSTLALTYPDHSALYDLVGEDAGRFRNFYPQQETTPTLDTDTTINSFLSHYGGNDEKELELINRLIFTPIPQDYSQVLASGQQDETAKQENDPIAQAAKAIDSILERAKPQTEQPVMATDETESVKEPTENDDSMLSESLAKIFIKQGKYAKALEIIRNISLKFPEKSIYFADQIRFLQKLILNEQINNR